jgi:tetratricopeptide (TPR) repeat protein
LNRIKKELIEKYRENINEIIEDDEDLIKKEMMKIFLYIQKIDELSLPGRYFTSGDWIIIGLYSYYEGQFPKAVSAFEKSLLLNHHNFEACFNLAVSFSIQDIPDKSVRAYKKAIRLNPQYPEAFCNLGIELEKLNRNEEAQAAFNKAIELKPDYPEVYKYIGLE